MKRYLYFAILALVLFISCSPYPREKERMEAAMEQAESIYGDGNLMIETDTVLFIPGLSDASAYYARKKQFGKAALAALYNGYAEKDYDKEMAMNSFKDAERYGEMANDSLTMARAQYHMGRMLLLNDYMFEDALSLLRTSKVNLGKHYEEKALTFDSEACLYLILKEYDKADSCFNQSLQFAELGQSDKVKNKALNNFSVLYLKQGQDEKAIACLRKVKPLDSQQTILNQLNLGNAFLSMGNLDSAEYYFQFIEEHLSIAQVKDETKAATYESLSKMAIAEGNYQDAVVFLKERERYVAEVVGRRERKTIYFVQQKYDNEIIQRKLDGLSIQRKHMFLITCLLLAIILGFALVVYYRYIQKRIHEVELNNVLIQFMEQNESLLKQDAEREKERHMMVGQLLKMQNERIQAMQKLDVFLKDRKNAIPLSDLEKQLFKGKDHLEMMMEMIDEAYPGLAAKIEAEYPTMDDLEKKVCLLSQFKLSRNDEAKILGISVSVLDKVRGRVKKLMGSDENG